MNKKATKYTVKTRINGGNGCAEIGEEIELTDRDARELLACGAIEVLVESEEKPKKSDRKKDGSSNPEDNAGAGQ